MSDLYFHICFAFLDYLSYELLPVEHMFQTPLEMNSETTGQHGNISGGWSCRVCGRRFSSKCYLVRHMRSHTGEKPFSCDICSAVFVRKDSRNRHLYKTHGIVKDLK